MVYVRQSSLQQVRDNLESQRLQYALVDRARSLGWSEVEVIDVDLGMSAGLGAEPRRGFDQLVGAVAQGQVGIVLAREASRLSRTDKDWCRLLEVCQIFDTLIGDDQQLYDLSSMDDQLVLGIKGTLSVVELKILRMRLLQGRDAKAARGELAYRLAAGYVHDSAGRVVVDPDRRIRERIALVFSTFARLWSARQTFKWFLDQGLEVPVRRADAGSGVRIVWRLPTQIYIAGILRNPFYAGAYVFGRRERKTVFAAGRLVKRVGPFLAAERCRVFLPDHHEAYIDWQTYEANLRTLGRNALKTSSDPGVAAVRQGQALLAGLLRCRHCGRKLRVRYWGRGGTNPRYFCTGTYQAGGTYCISFAARSIDERIGEQVARAISPLGIAAAIEAADGALAEDEARCRALVAEVEQRTWEARRAREQYDAVDPRHRLVAEELERRWNETLAAQRAAESASSSARESRRALTALECQQLEWLGAHFPVAWQSARCPMELKKKIAHLVLEEILVELHTDPRPTLHFVLHWNGGCHTEISVPKTLPGRPRTSLEVLDVITKMAPRYGDDQIAAVLNRLGLRPARSGSWNRTRVTAARAAQSIPGHRTTPRDPAVLSLKAAATELGVSAAALRRLANRGILPMRQVVPCAPHEIDRADLESDRVKTALATLKATGRLDQQGGVSPNQPSLFS